MHTLIYIHTHLCIGEQKIGLGSTYINICGLIAHSRGVGDQLSAVYMCELVKLLDHDK